MGILILLSAVSALSAGLIGLADGQSDRERALLDNPYNKCNSPLFYL